MGTITGLIREIRNRDALICVLALSLSSYSIIMLNNSIYAEVATYFGIAREINTLFSGLVSLVFFFIAQKRPSLLDRKQMLLIACGTIIASFFILSFAIDYKIPGFTIVGLCFAGIGKGWCTIMLCFALCSLKSKRRTIAVIALSTALGEVLSFAIPAFSFNVGVPLTSLISLLMIVLLYRPSSKLLDEVTNGGELDNMETVNPESFLSPSHALYFCILLFSFATGYAFTLNEIGHAPASTDLAAFAIVFVAIWVSFSSNPKKEDSLFSFSALLVIAGFLIAPFTFFSEHSTANTLIRTGIVSFEMLLWMVYVSIGRRNIFALLPTLCLSSFMRSVGTDAGAITGHTSNDLIGFNSELAALLAALALFVFVAFLWVGFRKFSFSETISGVTSVNVTQAVPNSDQIEKRCATISAERGLTERESEIFAMLARGRNGQFIMDHFVISRNTVKSHIKHIYQKLDVHSQQELIDLVEPGRAR